MGWGQKSSSRGLMGSQEGGGREEMPRRIMEDCRSDAHPKGGEAIMGMDPSLTIVFNVVNCYRAARDFFGRTLNVGQCGEQR